MFDYQYENLCTFFLSIYFMNKNTLFLLNKILCNASIFHDKDEPTLKMLQQNEKKGSGFFVFLKMIGIWRRQAARIYLLNYKLSNTGV